MKRIEAFLQPDRLSKVVSALHALPRFPGFTVLDAHGQGSGRGQGGRYVYGEVDGLLYHSHRLLIVFCDDADANMISELIASVAHTGHPGDGIVVTSHVSKVRRVRDERPQEGREA